MPVLSRPLPAGVIDPAVVRGIRQASQATQVDFGFLMAEAAQESGFRADAKAAGSTAGGLFQFIDGTWLQIVQRFGAKHGLGELAQKITLDDSGRAHVADASLRQRILDLRRDPRLSAAFAAEFAKTNQDEIERAIGRKAQRADLYMAHFLGAGGASQFLKAVQHDGNLVAADLLPEAAAANRAVFYDARTGTPRTVAQVYRSLAQRIEAAAQSRAPSADQAAGTGPTDAATAARRAPASFLRGLGFVGGPLGQPLFGLLNAIAASALKLIRADRQPSPGVPPGAAAAVIERPRDPLAT